MRFTVLAENIVMIWTEELLFLAAQNGQTITTMLLTSPICKIGIKILSTPQKSLFGQISTWKSYSKIFI